MNINVYDVLTLENQEKYLVLDKTEENNTTYYYIAKINETETDIENNYKLVIVKEEFGNNVISEITGEDNLRVILPLFEK